MSLLSSIENFIAAADAVTTVTLGSDGQKVITDAVNAAEAVGGSGSVKFGTALTQATTDLLALGKDVSLYIVKLAIEAAVSEINQVQSTAQAQASAQVAAQNPIPAAAPSAPAVTPPLTLTPTPVVPSSITITGSAFENAVANVVAGQDINNVAANLVLELQGQKISVTQDQAVAAITAALPAS